MRHSPGEDFRGQSGCFYCHSERSEESAVRIFWQRLPACPDEGRAAGSFQPYRNSSVEVDFLFARILRDVVIFMWVSDLRFLESERWSRSSGFRRAGNSTRSPATEPEFTPALLPDRFARRVAARNKFLPCPCLGLFRAEFAFGPTCCSQPGVPFLPPYTCG
jgi:hypothetical protein